MAQKEQVIFHKNELKRHPSEFSSTIQYRNMKK